MSKAVARQLAEQLTGWTPDTITQHPAYLTPREINGMSQGLAYEQDENDNTWCFSPQAPGPCLAPLSPDKKTITIWDDYGASSWPITWDGAAYSTR